MRDYFRRIVGASFNDQGTESSVPSIRGIATEAGFGSTAQTTGVYLDDMPFADLIVPLSLPDMNPFDLERVEIMKGPQGTLFGSGALAGAVRYITRKPQVGTWEAKILDSHSQTDQGNDRSRVSAAAFNVPVGSDAAIRVVGLDRSEPGLYDMSASDNTGSLLRSDPDADRLDQRAGRAQVGWAPNERFGVAGLFFRQDTRLADTAFADQRATFDSSRVPFASPRDYEFGGSNFLATYAFDAATLLSSTNWLDKHSRLLTHAEWLFDLQDQNQSEFYDLLIGDVSGFTQELRLLSGPGTWTWLVGAAHLKYDAEYFQYEPQPGPVGTPPPNDRNDVSPNERTSSFLYATIDSISRESALFGEATYSPGDRWEVSAGARIYETRMVADTVIAGTQASALTQEQESRGHFEPESTGVNPKATLRYSPTENISLYALVAKGFQFGGVQVNPSSPLLSDSAEQAGFSFGPYRSSKLWNYEAGSRTEWFDGQLRFDVTAFYLDWTDLQLTVRVPIAPTAATFGVIANVGQAHSEGIETSLDVLVVDGCRWTSSAAWINAVTDVAFDEDNPAGPVRAGTRLPGTPHFQWVNLVSYEHAVPRLEEWTAGMELVHAHVGESPDAIRQAGTIGGYETVDASIRLAGAVGGWEPEFVLSVTNLTDAHGSTYHSRLTSASNEPVDFYHFLRPRTALLSVGLRY